MRETCPWPLSQEDPPEKRMATHSNLLAWRTHRQRRLVGYNPWGHKESDMTELLTPSLASILFSHPEFLRAHHMEWLQGVTAVRWLLDGRYSFLSEFPQSSLAHHPRWLQLLVTVTSLFTNTARNRSLWTMTIAMKLRDTCSLEGKLWTVAYQASQSMGFSRQEYWSGLPFPSPGDLPDPGIELRSSALEAGALTSEPPGKPKLEDNCFTMLC